MNASSQVLRPLLLKPLLRAKWDLAVLLELATPCHMAFDVICDSRGNIVDFEWRHADPIACSTLGYGGVELVGKRLRSFISDQALAATMFEVYQCAFRTKKLQTAIVHRGDWSGMHLVRPMHGGVNVVISSESASERVAGARSRLCALETAAGKGKVEAPTRAVGRASKMPLRLEHAAALPDCSVAVPNLRQDDSLAG